VLGVGFTFMMGAQKCTVLGPTELFQNLAKAVSGLEEAASAVEEVA